MWDWNDTNSWASVIGCVAATLAALMGDANAGTEAASLLPTWLPPETTALGASILGGFAGLAGGRLVDWLRARE